MTLPPLHIAEPGHPREDEHADAELDAAMRRRRTGVVRFLLHRPGLLAAVLVLAAVVLAAVAPVLLTSADPLFAQPAIRLQGPSASYWFGTDELGRDLFARVVHGTRQSLVAALLASGIALACGSAIGLISGFAGGRVDDVLMRGVDVLLAIPGLLLSLAIVTALGTGPVNAAIAVGAAGVAEFARLMRAEVLRVRTATYVHAARSIGARWGSILCRHVLPNAKEPVLALATLNLGASVLAVSALSFLGYGAAPPTPEWGSLIASGRNHLANAWWLSTLPGLVVAAVVISVTRVARALDGEWGRR